MSKPSTTTPPTKRQIQVLKLIADGKENHEMATELGVSIKTIEKHRTAIYKKVGAHNVAQVIKAGVRLGLVKY